MRDIYNLPRMSLTYIVENLLSIHHGFKVDLMSCYQKYFKSLLNTNATPVRILTSMLRSDLCLVTGQNLAMIMSEAKIDPLEVSQRSLIERLRVRRKIPDGKDWILEVVSGLLDELDGSDDIDVREETREMLDAISIA